MNHLFAPLLLAAVPSAPAAVQDCRFATETLAFAGTPAEQAQCLMRRVSRGGVLSPQPLPDVLQVLFSGAAPPSAAHKAAALARFPEPYRSFARDYALWPLSRTEGGAPALYFVIHDTSMPFLGAREFPARLDRDPDINDLSLYFQDEPVAHLFVNRAGQVWAGHDLARGWRATKLETRVVAGTGARGRFIHVELVQPRRFAPGSITRAGTLAPRPGFSRAQYRQLAALYVYASARAGRWLIPAFHATVDAGIPEAHDDPQNFDISAFASELQRILAAAQAD